MMNQPIYNPPVPFCGLVPGGALQPNLMIKINGITRPSPISFAINLQLGPRVNPRDDLALHLSPIFTHPQRVVRNSLQQLTWGAEESHGGFPFSPGQPFEVIILVEHNYYKIAINGYHFTEFAHRLPFNHVSHLTIDGDVQINSILYEMLAGSGGQQHTSAPIPPYPTSSPMGGMGGMPPYPTTSGSSFVPPMPQYNPQYNPGGGAGYMPTPGYHSGNQPYPTQPGASFTSPPVYPSGSGAYNNYAQPGGYVKPKKNKGILSGSGILPAAGAIGGTLLGASLLSRAIPKVKLFKGPKFFKHKGFKHKGFGFGGMGMGKHKFGKFKGPKFGKFGKFKGPKW